MMPSTRDAWVAWIVLAVLVAGCAPTGGATPNSAAPTSSQALATAPAPAGTAPAALLPITVHSFGASVNTAIIQYGIERGFYRDEGLEVGLQVADASVGVQLTTTGHVDFTTSVGSAIAAAVRGIPIKIIFATADRPLWWMYVDPKITSVAGLRGKKLGVSSAGSSLTITVRLILEKYGIGPDDATIVNLGTPQRYPALESGAVDAAFLSTPQNLVAEQAGFRPLFNSKDEGILLITEGLAAGDTFLREKPDVVRRMLRASLRAVRGMHSDRQGAINTVARYNDISLEEAAHSYESGLATWTPDGTAELPAMRQSIEIMKLSADVDTLVPEDQVFDLRIARELAAERPQR
jgi:ABC-type nitrate/sulfonate/bicarbonate transport system substrate-binding protein